MENWPKQYLTKFCLVSAANYDITLMQIRNMTVRFEMQYVRCTACLAELLAASGALRMVLVTDSKGQASQEGALGE